MSSLDPCKEYEPCDAVPLNSTLKGCEAFSATSYECQYSCDDSYYPIEGDPANGCASKCNFQSDNFYKLFSC